MKAKNSSPSLVKKLLRKYGHTFKRVTKPNGERVWIVNGTQEFKTLADIRNAMKLEE